MEVIEKGYLTDFDFWTDDTAMMWGIKFHNDLLMEAGPHGIVESDLLFQKDLTFRFHKGWDFPRRVFFNGDASVMAAPDAYPLMPIAGLHIAACMHITDESSISFSCFFCNKVSN